MNKIAFLGPEGSFSYQIYKSKYNSYIGVFAKSIRSIFEMINDDIVSLGIVPIENSIGGTLGETLDCLPEYNLNINKEILLLVRHYLCSFDKDIKKIETLYCHPQAYAQCEKFVRKNLPKVKIQLTPSNSESAKILKKSKKKNIAAIIPKVASELYKIPIIKPNIQDNNNNTTRFIIISKKESERTDEDRTSLSIHPTTDKPGLLFNILKYFAENKINLTKIESRPSKGKLGEYIFFIDIEGNQNDDNIIKAFKKINKLGKINIHGSYKKQY